MERQSLSDSGELPLVPSEMMPDKKLFKSLFPYYLEQQFYF